MALGWRGSKNNIQEGICPTCKSILSEKSVNFTIDNKEIRDITLGGRITINTFGSINIKRCYSGHEHVIDIDWNGISFSCAGCHTQLVNDKNKIRCLSCGYDTDFLKLVGIYQKVVDLALADSGFVKNASAVTKYFHRDEGLRKWTDLLNVFFDTYKLESAAADENMPEMVEYFPNPKQVHPTFKYIAMGLLAYGGFSKIYLGKDMKGNYVIIKVPWGYRNEDEKRSGEKRINPYNIAEDKLRIESDFLQNIKKNPNFAGFIEEYLFDGMPHLVMEFLPGETLSKHVKEAKKSNNPISEDSKKSIIENVVKIIQHIHINMDRVHRDITPSNFVITKQALKMIDFGTVSLDTGLKGADKTGIQAGGYHPPEQAQGVSSKLCDIYSIGSLMYFVVTGKDPPDPLPDTPTDKVMVHELRKNEETKIYEKAIMKARSFLPSYRYPSINDLYKDLVEIWYQDRRLCTICGEMSSKNAAFCVHCNSLLCGLCGNVIKNEDEDVCPHCKALICVRCAAASPEGAKYCTNCGRGLPSDLLCDICSGHISHGAMFCKSCGGKVPMVANV